MMPPRARLAAFALLAMTASPALAQDRHAVIVFGASGAEKYAVDHARWEASLTSVLEERYGFAPDRITVLTPGAAPALRSTRENVRRVLAETAVRAAVDDLVFVLLIGHGTVDTTAAKFNLPGPDLDESEWAALLRPIKSRLLFINSAAGSFPFLQRLAGPNRIVITATDSGAQRFHTVFPEHLVEALNDPAADRDKNGRLSVWELFTTVSAAVRGHYERRGQLPTERPLLDDDGDGRGSEAEASGPDGVLARTTYLAPNPIVPEPGSVLSELLERQRALEREAEEWKLKKGSVPLERWEAEFERIMIELARVSRAIRSRS
ncbi:MAG TPA: hypothetical protein VNK41_06895 [Vicinamibacterales bacterium]|nr:hypothetical protein [Vicinamibacterales bacterium]